MKNIIQSVIDMEKDCAARLEKANKDAQASTLAADRKSKTLLENVQSEASRSFAEKLSSAEIVADQTQKEALAKVATNYAPIDDDQQNKLAQKALLTLLGN